MHQRSDQERLLIVGASILQLPAIIKAKEQGYYVGVVDYNPNAIGIQYADEYFNVSTIDEEGVTEVACGFKPNGIITLATDMPMRAIAAANAACGLSGISYETAIKATDKAAMIQAFEINNVDHPWFFIIENKKQLYEIKNQLLFPCVIKPTDNAGSRGVALAHNYEELKEEYNYSFNESRSGKVIVEEYLEGPEFSVEVMVVNNEPHILQITDKITTGAPHFVEMGHSQPSMQPIANQKKICALAKKACKAIGITCGPAHVEMIYTKAGPKMVELGARMGGDCITTHLVPLSTGIDMIGATIDVACGKKPILERQYSKGSAIRYFDSKKGVLKSIDGLNKAKKVPGVRDIILAKEAGDVLTDIGSSGDRVGFVIAQANTPEDAIIVCEKALKQIRICIET